MPYQTGGDITMAIQKMNQSLPQETAEALSRSRADKKAFRANVKALYDAGWTLTAMSNVSGLTRERIRQISLQEPEVEPTLEVPTPPEKPIRPKTRKRFVIKPDPEVLAKLFDLKPIAQSVRFAHTAGRRESEEYTRLIAQEVDRGVTIYQMAKALGLTPQAIRLRLIRYGYMEPSEKLVQNNPDLIRPLKHRIRF